MLNLRHLLKLVALLAAYSLLADTTIQDKIISIQYKVPSRFFIFCSTYFELFSLRIPCSKVRSYKRYSKFSKTWISQYVNQENFGWGFGTSFNSEKLILPQIGCQLLFFCTI